jgi:hypothetical protein
MEIECDHCFYKYENGHKKYGHPWRFWKLVKAAFYALHSDKQGPDLSSFAVGLFYYRKPSCEIP